MKSWITGLVVALLLAAPVRVAAELPAAQDLERDGSEASRLHVPILLFFSSDSCPYCRVVEELYLEPMHARGEYAGRLLIRVVHTGRRAPLRDFAGQAMSHAEFARAQGVNFTPNVRFYDAQGREVAPALVGYSSADFYAGYLESAIARAMAAVVPR